MESFWFKPRCGTDVLWEDIYLPLPHPFALFIQKENGRKDYRTVKNLGNIFRPFAQRCANSQPNHLLGNILPSGIGKRKHPTSHVHNCFVF